MHLRDSSGIYGAERVILTLGKNIDKERVDFSLLCLDRQDGMSARLVTAARKICIITHQVKVLGKFDLKAIATIRDLILSNRIQIVHSHDFKSDLYSLLATWNIPVKRISTAHGSTRDSVWKRLYLRFNESIVYRFFTKVIAVSEELYGQLTKAGLSPGKVIVIQNGLDSQLLELQEDDFPNGVPFPVPDDAITFSVIGRLYPDKGHRYFLSAFSSISRKYPNAYAMIVGDGPSRAEIDEWIRKAGLGDKVFALGVRNDMRNIYKRTRFLIIPSLREGLPYVLLESFYNRIPVLATNVGDIPKLIQNEITGYLVPPGDANALEESMIAMLEREDKAKYMAENAYKLVCNKYSKDNMIHKTMHLYLSLIVL
jgi:glycosyltransferase involved in cell wall biosynthesis